MSSVEKPSVSDPLLTCTGLEKRFVIHQQEVSVLRGVNLSVGRGEIVVITGKSGSGKSTLLGLLAGLDRPDSGKIYFGEKELGALSREKLALLRRTAMSIIFQSFNLLPSWTALENVEAALFYTGMSKKRRREKAREYLEQLRLGDVALHLPAEMSVGQQQRVAVARALVNEPALVFADEPTGDVDPETGREIVDLLIAAVRGKGATLLVATHGGFPLDVARRVLVLKDGVLE
jgi:putative ABC transport system ATP-binding protein